MQTLNPQQITLWGYMILRDELMDGGFVQLIYNGYGPFFFDNPFAKAMRLWGLHDLSKMIYKAKKVYDENKQDLTQERTDEEFMALFEEENFTSMVAHYVDEHIADFVNIEKE